MCATETADFLSFLCKTFPSCTATIEGDSVKRTGNIVDALVGLIGQSIGSYISSGPHDLPRAM